MCELKDTRSGMGTTATPVGFSLVQGVYSEKNKTLQLKQPLLVELGTTTVNALQF